MTRRHVEVAENVSKGIVTKHFPIGFFVYQFYYQWKPVHIFTVVLLFDPTARNIRNYAWTRYRKARCFAIQNNSPGYHRLTELLFSEQFICNTLNSLDWLITRCDCFPLRYMYPYWIVTRWHWSDWQVRLWVITGSIIIWLYLKRKGHRLHVNWNLLSQMWNGKLPIHMYTFLICYVSILEQT